MNKYFLIALLWSLGLVAQEQDQMQVIEELLHSYSRDVTVLNLSNHKWDGFSILCKKFPTSVFVSRIGSQEENSVLFSKNPSSEDITNLSHHEHFDLAFYLGACPYKQKMIQALLTLSDHVLLEMPKDLQNLMNDFLIECDAQILDYKNSHFLILITRHKPKYIHAHEHIKDKQMLITSRHYALMKSHQDVTAFPPGLSLYGYKLLQGIYPSYEDLAKALSSYRWRQSCACLPWNIILKGNHVLWVPRFNEPKAWSRDGLKWSLKGLKIDDFEEYKTFCTKQLTEIGVAG